MSHTIILKKVQGSSRSVTDCTIRVIEIEQVSQDWANRNVTEIPNKDREIRSYGVFLEQLPSSWVV